MRRSWSLHSVICPIIVAVCFLLLSPPHARGVEPGALKSVGEKLERWDAEGAWIDIQPLLVSRPRDGEVLDMAAQIAFFRGDYPGVLTFARAALESGDDARRRAFAGFAESTLNTVKDYKQYQTEHFVIRLDEKKDAILVTYLADALERTYRIVADQFGFRPAEKVRVELFPDTRAFYYATTLTARDIEVSGAVGLTQFNKLLFLSPRALVRGYRWLDAISHEYMHYMIMKLTAAKAPIWFHEGLAEHEETRWRGEKPGLSPIHETLLARALADDGFISFQRMDPGLVKLQTPEEVQLAYAEAASSIQFIVSKTGYEGLRAIMSHMASSSGQGTEDALKAVLGLSMSEFDDKWKEFLRTRGLKTAEGVDIHHFKVREGLADDDRMEMREIKSMVARNRAHLGDLLREKGRPEAAVLEYRRALSDAADSVPVLNRLSETLVLLGRDAEALEHLMHARRLDPDHPVTYAALGQVYLKLKDWKQAEQALEDAIQINPFMPLIHRDLAICYEMQGKKDAGRKENEIFAILTR